MVQRRAAIANNPCLAQDTTISSHQAPYNAHQQIKVSPVIGINNQSDDDVCRQRCVGDHEQRLGLGSTQRVREAKRQRADADDGIQQSANPSGVQNHAEVDVVHFFMMVLAAKILRTNAKGMIDQDVDGFQLSAKAALGASVVGLHECGAILKQPTDAIGLECSS